MRIHKPSIEKISPTINILSPKIYAKNWIQKITAQYDQEM